MALLPGHPRNDRHPCPIGRQAAGHSAAQGSRQFVALLGMEHRSGAMSVPYSLAGSLVLLAAFLTTGQG
jgi:hypothetical protein